MLKLFMYYIGENVVSSQMLKVSLLGGVMVLRLERDAWSMANVEGKQQVSTLHLPNFSLSPHDPYLPPPSPPSRSYND